MKTTREDKQLIILAKMKYHLHTGNDDIEFEKSWVVKGDGFKVIWLVGNDRTARAAYTVKTWGTDANAACDLVPIYYKKEGTNNDIN